MKRKGNIIIRALPAAVIFILSACGTLRAQIAEKMAGELKLPDDVQNYDDGYTGTVSSAFTGIIKGYQDYVSPYYPSRCPFYPSCSNYGLQSVQKYGSFWGSIMAFERLMRCNLNRDAYPVSTAIETHGHPALWDVPENNFLFSSEYNLDDTWFLGSPVELLETNKYDLTLELTGDNETLKRTFGFALQLLSGREYNDALKEFRRISYLYPDDPDIEKADFMLGITNFLKKDWKLANESLAGFLLIHKDSALQNEARFRLAYSLLKTKDFLFAEKSAAEILKDPASSAEDRTDAEFFRFISAIEQKNAPKAIESKNALQNNHGLILQLSDEELNELSDLPYKSELLGSTASALLPGSGQLYAGRYKDALATFFITGTFGYATYEAYDSDLNAATALLGSAFLIFYTANVYGGARAVRQYNNELERRYAQDIKMKTRQVNRYWFFVSQEFSGRIGVSFEF